MILTITIQPPKHRRTQHFMGWLVHQSLFKATLKGSSSMQIVATLASLLLMFILIGLLKSNRYCPSILTMFIVCSLQVFLLLPSSWMICKFKFLFFFSFITSFDQFVTSNKAILLQGVEKSFFSWGIVFFIVIIGC